MNAGTIAALETDRLRHLWDGTPSEQPREPGLDAAADDLDLALIRTGSRATDGGTFVFDAPVEVPALWGAGDAVLWAEGETLFFVGPEGTGKTGLMQQLALARHGLLDGLLDLPVIADDGRTLYVAADRPAQAARSWRRMVDPECRATLSERLTVWRGPLPFDVGAKPDLLLPFVKRYDATSLFIDSMKDVALDLTKDEVGSRVNHALQTVLADGRQAVVNHHQRKQQAGAGKPRGISDVYGSRWLTAGAGSVVLLWGEPGDALVELSHLKQPAGDVGPLKLLHDHHAGRTTVVERVDVWDLVHAAPNGITAQEVACRLFETAGPTKNQIERARRRLDALHRAQKIHKTDGAKGGAGGGQAARYQLITLLGGSA